jgi:DNA processing protein
VEEYVALLILSHTNSIGNIKARKLVDYFGSATEVFSAQKSDLLNVHGIGHECAEELLQWKDNDAWRRDLEAVEEDNVMLLPYTDARYPKMLRNIPDSPNILYVKGSLTPADRNSIAVVGTRAPTIYGKEMAERFGYDLAHYSFTVVSGFARGVDTAAHHGALRKGRTIAVIGSGLGHIYPPENTPLVAHVEQRGAIISELPMNAPPDKRHFPRRNRLVSGMTRGTVVIEAPVKSGSLITARYARQHGKALFALPGRADIESFRGNHILIKNGDALLVESARDIAEHFDDLFAIHGAPPQKKKQEYVGNLSQEEAYILEKMSSDELTIDELACRVQIPIDKINVMLMGLVLKRRIREYPGKIYKKI